MTHLLRLLALSALIFVTACSNPGRFGGFGGFGGDGALDPNAAGNGADPASDPTSPAFFSQTIGDRVLFAVDQSTLSPEAQSILEQQAVWLMTNADYEAIIEGHADEQGTREHNLGLGAKRANAVKEYLVTQGVAASRLATVTYGKERPIEICSEEVCYAKNRRAVTVITATAGS